MKHHETVVIQCDDIGARCETSALDVETSAFVAATSAIAQRSFDETIWALDAETSALSAATSAIARSYRGYQRGVSGDIGDCGVGITPQMCNRVTNHRDMSTFSKPGTGRGVPPPPVEYNCCVCVFSKHKQGRPKNIATDW